MKSQDHKVIALCKYIEKIEKISIWKYIKKYVKKKITPLPKYFQGIIVETYSGTSQSSSKELLFSLYLCGCRKVIEPKITYWYILKSRRKMNC